MYQISYNMSRKERYKHLPVGMQTAACLPIPIYSLAPAPSCSESSQDTTGQTHPDASRRLRPPDLPGQQQRPPEDSAYKYHEQSGQIRAAGKKSTLQTPEKRYMILLRQLNHKI